MPNVLKKIIYVIVGMFILYIPFSMVAGVRHRFLYMVQIPFLLFAAASFNVLIRSAMRSKSFKNIIYVLILIFIMMNGTISYTLS